MGWILKKELQSAYYFLSEINLPTGHEKSYKNMANRKEIPSNTCSTDDSIHRNLCNPGDFICFYTWK